MTSEEASQRRSSTVELAVSLVVGALIVVTVLFRRVRALGGLASGMAIAESFPPNTIQNTRVLSGTNELRALLTGYAGALEDVNNAPAILWPKLARPRLLRWLRFPAPRAVVRILVVRHVSRCVDALKRTVAGHAALGDDAPGVDPDLEMLEHFEQSLPTGLRVAVIWPLGLLAALLVAHTLATVGVTGDSGKLLGNLAMASVNLDRRAAITAFTAADRAARGSTDEALLYGFAAMMVALSVLLVIAPLLPAFVVKRRLLAQVASLEEEGFAALGARRVHDIEFDLIAQLLMTAPVAFFSILVVLASLNAEPGDDPPSLSLGVMGASLFGLTVLAGVELRARYAARRGRRRWHSTMTRVSLLLVCVLPAGWLINVMVDDVLSGIHREPIYMSLSDRTQFDCGRSLDDCELDYAVTAIQQNAPCADPYRPLKPGEQFLRFDLDVVSHVDEFSDPTLAHVLNLGHWSVAGSDGVPEGDIYIYTKCSDGTEAIAHPIVPGTHTKPVVVINAPKRAEFLQLELPNHDVTRWRVPPVG